MRTWALTLGIAGWVFATGAARAEDSEAERLFREGRDAMETGRYDEACSKLERSQRLEPLLPKLAFVAVCHERQGKTATAFREYLEVAASAKNAGLADREAKARELAERLAPKLLRLRLTLSTPRPEQRVECNDAALPAPAEDGVIALDPGEYRCRASAPGYVSRDTTFVLDEGHREVVVELAALEPRAIDPLPAPSAPVPARPTFDARPFYAAGGVMFGVGLAGVVVGAVYGARTFELKSESDDLCERGCDEAGAKAFEDARTSSYVSTASFIIGAAALATGTVLTVWGATRPAPGLRVGVGPRGAFMTGAW